MIRQVCSSYRTLSSAILKEKLVKSVKGIRGIENAFHFCNLVSETTGIINQTKSTSRHIPILKCCENTVMETEDDVADMAKDEVEEMLEKLKVLLKDREDLPKNKDDAADLDWNGDDLEEFVKLECEEIDWDECVTNPAKYGTEFKQIASEVPELHA